LSSTCGDSVEVENTASSSNYQITSGAGTFNFRNWQLGAYSNQALTSLLTWTATGASSLYTAGSLSITLPEYPRTVYLRVPGAVPGGATVTMGDTSKAMINHYRIRARRCLGLLELGKPLTASAYVHFAGGLTAKAGKSYTITAVPSGSNVKTTRTALRAVRVPTSTACGQQPESQSCRPIVIASRTDTQASSKGVSLSFAVQQSESLRLEVSNLKGLPVNWRLTASER
jgi:hypothetical protein